MNSQIPSKCADCTYRGRHIYVVGTQRFERELVVSHIQTNTASVWNQVEHLEDIPVGNQDVPLGQKMILIDAHMLNRENLLQLFCSNAWKIHAHNLMVLINVLHDHNIEKEALKSGARGILYDDDSVADLIKGICDINSGNIWASHHILSECLLEIYINKDQPEPASHPLSEREVELLKVLTTGASNDMIADRMCISSHTVKTHLQNIFHKINVGNRLQAVLWAKKSL